MLESWVEDTGNDIIWWQLWSFGVVLKTFSPPHLTCVLAGDRNEHLRDIWGLVQGGSLKRATSFIFLLLFMYWFKMTGKDLVKIVPSNLPLHSSVLIIIEMFFQPHLLGNFCGLLLDTSFSDCNFSHCHSLKTFIANCSIFSFAVGFLNDTFLRSLLI